MRPTPIKPDQLPAGTIPVGEQDKIVVLQKDNSGKYIYKSLPPEAFRGERGSPGRSIHPRMVNTTTAQALALEGVQIGDLLLNGHPTNNITLCGLLVAPGTLVQIPASGNGTNAGSVQGQQGFSITGFTVQYQVSSSGTIVPIGTWHNAPLQTTQVNPFLWTRIRFTRQVEGGSMTDTAYSVSSRGADGGGGGGTVDDSSVPIVNRIAMRLGGHSIHHGRPMANQISSKTKIFRIWFNMPMPPNCRIQIWRSIGGRNSWSQSGNQLSFSRLLYSSNKLLPKDKFDDAIKWLDKQIAIFRPGLKKSDNEQWRKDMYKSIFAKARQFNIDIYEFATEVLELKKPIDSLKELNDTKLQKLYDKIFSKK